MTTLTLPATAAAFAPLDAWLDAAATAMDGATAFRLRLVAHEAVGNVVMHAGATGLTLRLEAGPVLTVEDDGVPFDPSAYQPPPPAADLETAALGGRGILLMRANAAMAYTRSAGRNRLTLTLRPAAAAGGGSGQPTPR